MPFWRSILLSVSILILQGAPPHARPRAHAQAVQVAREVAIVVEHGAYQPSVIELQAGERVRLKFLRKERGSCTREVVFPKLDIRRELPTNQVVFIDLPPLAAGVYEFHCAMNMVKGRLEVKPNQSQKTRPDASRP